MALNHPQRRFALRKFWFQNQTSTGKIRPTYLITSDRMNEELRQASELAKDPNAVSWLAAVWIVLLSTLGGVVRVLREVKLGGKSWRKILGVFVVEILISNFTGVLTYFLCMSRGVGQFETAFFTSLAAYMGPRALNALEAMWKAWAKGE